MTKKIRIIGAAVVAALWLGISVFAWVQPPKAASTAERRPLDQFPELSVEELLSTDFMSDFEDYTLDQFPARDLFRQIKALFHYNVLGQKDNNSIIIHDGFAAQMEYPLNETSINYATKKFASIYNKNLKRHSSKVFVTVVPDKGYYLPENSGYLTMDYEKLFSTVAESMPYAQYIDLTGDLSLEDYYFTDTHWRQEAIVDAAGTLCEAMGVTAPKMDDYSIVALDKPFYGVYYGQAALPMQPEPLYYLQNDLLDSCIVTNHETGKSGKIYDMSKLGSNDLYEVFLSGSVSLLTIENPNAKTDKELIVFRDSFGSSMVPLLVQDYATVTVVDIRYLNSAFLSQFIDFHGQDVLFLYSTLVLNNSSTLK